MCTSTICHGINLNATWFLDGPEMYINYSQWNSYIYIFVQIWFSGLTNMLFFLLCLTWKSVVMRLWKFTQVSWLFHVWHHYWPMMIHFLVSLTVELPCPLLLCDDPLYQSMCFWKIYHKSVGKLQNYKSYTWPAMAMISLGI